MSVSLKKKVFGKPAVRIKFKRNNKTDAVSCNYWETGISCVSSYCHYENFQLLLTHNGMVKMVKSIHALPSERDVDNIF